MQAQLYRERLAEAAEIAKEAVASNGAPEAAPAELR
jgi:hypothetical protein